MDGTETCTPTGLTHQVGGYSEGVKTPKMPNKYEGHGDTHTHTHTHARMLAHI